MFGEDNVCGGRSDYERRSEQAEKSVHENQTNVQGECDALNMEMEADMNACMYEATEKRCMYIHPFCNHKI